MYLQKCYCLFFIFTLVLLKESIAASNECTKRNAKSCSDCMEIPGCAWCEHPDYDSDRNIIVYRCDLPENLVECPKAAIINPSSKVKPVVDDPHSSVGGSVGKATQLKPQKISARLRPGSPGKVEVSYKQAEDYPVDLYYLLDLSSSMKDDLESLRKLGKQLGQNMSSITKNFRLGFGSFVDKTVMPFISTVESKLKNPCLGSGKCDPAYSFHNDLPLTTSIDDFVDKVNNVTHSSNLDSPEGGLDAMMQAIVCTDKIKWRDEATHLLVYVTDAVFHYAGDGKLGGIVEPNDGECYLDSTGNYYKANYMDYPSIGHLVEKINAFGIQPIFAVTKTVYATYEKLEELIPLATVGELSEDSSNIIGLIQTAYENLRGRVVLGVDPPTGVKVVSKTAHCTSGDRKDLECEGLKIGDVVNFTLSIEADQCITGEKTMKIKVYGYNDEAVVNISTLCDCECNTTAPPSVNCSGNGEYECGACVCDPGYLGLDCSCDKKDTSSAELHIQNCTEPGSDYACTSIDRGECLCGSCLCWQSPGKKVYGSYCECDNVTCDIIDDKICNGHGECDCGTCKCTEGWTGKACTCTPDKSTCSDPGNPQAGICHGAGLCECGGCQCNTTKSGHKYRGKYCQISPSTLCQTHAECVECRYYGNRDLYDPSKCKSVCERYDIKLLNGSSHSSGLENCRIVDNVTDCTYDFWHSTKDNKVYVETDPSTQVCPNYANPMYIIIGIIAAIVGIGLAILLIWKLLTSIKDAREYKQWQKEVQGAKWETGGNPIYNDPKSVFKNPTYKGGQPTSNL